MVFDYEVVDVFTETALAGNPLAVVFETAGLSTDRLQAIAREFNLSETTFVQRRANAVERAEGVRVRIFTTREELPFAGHPTLGTASVLKRVAPEIVRDNTVTLALNVGAVPVRFANGDPLFGEMTQRDPEFNAALDRGEVARFLGLSTDDLEEDVAPQVVSTGTAFAIVVLKSMAALARLKVDQAGADQWLKAQGARWFYVLAPADAPADLEQGVRYRARMQFNGGEDPATGSAAGCAISYLVKHALAPSGERIAVRQGVEISRPSVLYLSARLDQVKVIDIRVGGSTVPVAKGKLFLP